jgi:hypothetical protein
MIRTPLRTSAAIVSAVAVASLTGLAGPASASGGDTPAIPAGINCDTNPLVLSKVGPGIAVNWAGDAGCVGIKTTATTVRLAWVVRSPGWTYVVQRNGGTTRDRVQILFTHTKTGTKLSFRYQLGKTVIG